MAPEDEDGGGVESDRKEEGRILDLRPDSDEDDDDAYEFLPDNDDPPIGAAKKEFNFTFKKVKFRPFFPV